MPERFPTHHQKSEQVSVGTLVEINPKAMTETELIDYYETKINTPGYRAMLQLLLQNFSTFKVTNLVENSVPLAPSLHINNQLSVRSAEIQLDVSDEHMVTQCRELAPGEFPIIWNEGVLEALREATITVELNALIRKQ